MTSLGCDEAVRDFLVESHENLDQLDREFLALEADPSQKRIATIFRTVHTIKGTAGFLGFSRLEKLAHTGETLLARARDGALSLTPEATSLLLAMVDKVRASLRSIENTGKESSDEAAELIADLKRVADGGPPRPATPPPTVSVAPPPPAAAAPPSIIPAAPQPEVRESSAPTKHDPPAFHLPLTSLPPAPRTAVPAAPRTAAPPPPRTAAPPAPRTATPPTARASAPPKRRESLRPDKSAAEAADASSASAIADSTVRIDISLLDRLMNLVGELVLARNRTLQLVANLEDTSLVGALQRLNVITTELQENVMKTRMQSIGTVWNKLPRVVRDLAVACGKQVRVEMQGKETELDRSILEAIRDPLTHIVRNAVDHGIESPNQRAAAGKARTGKVVLRAFHEGGQVIIELADDGAGIDPERIREKALQREVITPDQAARISDHELRQLVFLPGFSTAAKVTNVSGRGVGMDVVKTNIEKIGGTVDLLSQKGQGTTIRIKIPLTLAIVPAVIVESTGQRFAVPQMNLLELVRVEGDKRAALGRIHDAPIYRLRGKMLPLVHLDRVLELERPRPRAGAGAGVVENKAQESDVTNIVVLRADDRTFGLVVDEVHDTEEIVVKPLGSELKHISAIAGATIMGDGSVALILDVLGLSQLAGIVTQNAEKTLAKTEKLEVASAEAVEKKALLVCQIGDNRYTAIPLAQVERLEEFSLSKMETAGTERVIQYRGEILPIIDLSDAFGSSDRGEATMVQTIIYSEDNHHAGLIVDNILDIIESTAEVGRKGAGEGLLGAAVIQGRVTDLVDLKALIHARHPAAIPESAS
ncbi:MAG: chemotaxis protein CheA [Polyangiaceae bacterium]